MCRITQLLRPPQLGFHHPERRKVDNVLDTITMYSSLHTASCMAYPPVRRQKRDAFMPLNPSVRVHRNPAIGSGEPGEAKTWLACLFIHDRSQARDLTCAWLGLPVDAWISAGEAWIGEGPRWDLIGIGFCLCGDKALSCLLESWAVGRADI